MEPTRTYEVVDLFAGPGGLGEGFSAYRRPDTGDAAFHTAVSIEKDWSAYRTLRFRAFYRRVVETGAEVDWKLLDTSARDAETQFLERQSEQVRNLWEEASEEALLAELGGDSGSQELIESAISRVGPDSILIGGPPCQAYSLVGRARNRGIEGYRPEKDLRHYLYEEYVGILQRTNPVAFVMENVKGILSAKVRKQGVFDQIIADLEDSGYDVFPMAPSRSQTSFSNPDPRDFVIRSENYGIPQSRHRVIVLGLRRDLVNQIERPGIELRKRIPDLFGEPADRTPVERVLAGLPRLPSALSRRAPEGRTWLEAVHKEAQLVRKALMELDGLDEPDLEQMVQTLDDAVEELESVATGSGGAFNESSRLDGPLCEWLISNPPFGISNHEPRGHMPSDLGRYLFAACYAATTNISPKAPDFPIQLAPDHANWNSGKFADRFRVQIAGDPATTITSHISKDGHYYIHPDPAQCRSLTVREAARIQTFPDDYLFFGNRTQQYVQVGNAVPPFLARRIAATVDAVLGLA